MSRLHLLPVLLMLSLLGACDDKTSPPAGTDAPQLPVPAGAPAEQPAPAKPEPVQTPDALPAPGSKVVDDTSLPKPTDSKPKPAAKVSTHEELPPVKLDLHLPPELVEQLQPDEPLEEVAPSPLLPEMFVEKPKEPGPFELNGRLITNDREKSESYWDSVEGAELQFKFRN